MNKTAIIVPCYNETKRLKENLFLEGLQRYEEMTLVFVDDGSKDRTLDMLHSLANQNSKRIKVIPLTQNSGKAEAVRRGMVNALEEDFNFVGYLDADLSTSVDAIMEFPRILELANVEMVMGSRVKLLGKDIERNVGRHYLGRFFATYASICLKLAVYDTQCGAKLFKNTPRIKSIFSERFLTNWVFDVEILARYIIATHYEGSKDPSGLIVEKPLNAWKDIGGSKLKLPQVPTILKDMVVLAYCYSPTIYKINKDSQNKRS